MKRVISDGHLRTHQCASEKQDVDEEGPVRRHGAFLQYAHEPLPAEIEEHAPRDDPRDRRFSRRIGRLPRPRRRSEARHGRGIGRTGLRGVV